MFSEISHGGFLQVRLNSPLIRTLLIAALIVIVVTTALRGPAPGDRKHVAYADDSDPSTFTVYCVAIYGPYGCDLNDNFFSVNFFNPAAWSYGLTPDEAADAAAADLIGHVLDCANEPACYGITGSY
jgi:hypothetical protein